MLHPRLLGQPCAALDMPRAVRDTNDLATDVARDVACRTAQATPKVDDAHALFQAGRLGEPTFVVLLALDDKLALVDR